MESWLDQYLTAFIVTWVLVVFVLLYFLITDKGKRYYIYAWFIAGILSTVLIYVTDNLLYQLLKDVALTVNGRVFLVYAIELAVMLGVWIIIYNQFKSLNINKVIPWLLLLGVFGVLANIGRQSSIFHDLGRELPDIIPLAAIMSYLAFVFFFWLCFKDRKPSFKAAEASADADKSSKEEQTTPVPPSPTEQLLQREKEQKEWDVLQKYRQEIRYIYEEIKELGGEYSDDFKKQVVGLSTDERTVENIESIRDKIKTQFTNTMNPFKRAKLNALYKELNLKNLAYGAELKRIVDIAGEAVDIEVVKEQLLRGKDTDSGAWTGYRRGGGL